MAIIKEAVSYLRKLYEKEFIFKCILVVAAFVLFFFAPECFDVIDGMGFFTRFSPLHIMWAIWMYEMILKLLPYRKALPIGAQKHFLEFFKPTEIFSKAKLEAYIKSCGRMVFKVALAWGILIAGIGALYFTKVINKSILFLISMLFYLSDIICVLFWCPFREFLMKNRCCTTCRIYNWDHFMMFSPFIFIPGFYTWSLLGLGIIILIIWESGFVNHPERYWEGSNKALRCSHCTDRLCKERRCAPDFFDTDELQ